MQCSSPDAQNTQARLTSPQKLPLIEARNICHRFDHKTVLNEVSLRIMPGEILTIIGPNGAGKSTLLKILLGLLNPTEGTLKKASGLRIGFMPQKIHIDSSLPLTVQRFLTLSKKTQTAKNFSTHMRTVVSQLQLESLINQPIQHLSGGETQRVLLARALLNQPDLLVLDEPVQGVDLQGQTQLYEYIHQIQHTYQCAIVMVSHDLHVVMKDTHQVLCLNQHICCQGPPQAVSANPEFKHLFGDGYEQLAVYEHHHTAACDHH